MGPLAICSLTSFLIAACVALAIAPIVRRAASRQGFVDRPDNIRKRQEKPIALGGGIVVAVGLFAALATVELIAPSYSTKFIESRGAFAQLSVVASAIFIVFVGVIDDRFGMRGRRKLWLQFVASVIVVFGCQIYSTNIVILGSDIAFGVFGFAVPVIWILCSINAFNFIDGVDGLAPSVGAVVGIATGCIALCNGKPFDATLSFALAGALFGFLRFNIRPATMYLGDAGSMLVGLTLGAASLRCLAPSNETTLGSPLIAIWAILLFDLFAAVMRRKLDGKSIYDSDRQHIHHRLLSKGLSLGQTVVVIAGLAGTASVAAVLEIWLQMSNLGIAVSTALVFGLIAFGLFGELEFRLLTTRVAAFLGDTLPISLRDDSCSESSWTPILVGIMESQPRNHCLETATTNPAEDAQKYFEHSIFEDGPPFVSDSKLIFCNGTTHTKNPVGAVNSECRNVPTAALLDNQNAWHSIDATAVFPLKHTTGLPHIHARHFDATSLER